MDLSNYEIGTVSQDIDTTLFGGTSKTTSSRILLRVANADDPDVRSRLLREFGLRESLDPSWALRPSAVTSYFGRTALVYESGGWTTLGELIAPDLDLHRLLHASIGVASVLGEMHRSRVTHRDIRPSNILIDGTGNVRFIGFGLSEGKLMATSDDSSVVRFEYMSPEHSGRTNRAVDVRSDLYSLGICLYQMLTGVMPFKAADLGGWTYAHIARRPPAPSEIVDGLSPAFDAIVSKLLAKAPDDRYQTATGLGYDLMHCLTDLSTVGAIRTFEVGTHDGPSRIALPKKLYGRDSQLERLFAGFEEVSHGNGSGVFLVSGYSGSGKSALMNALHGSLRSSDAIVAWGKFDQYRADMPYATITQAFGRLIDQLLRAPSGELELWRADLVNALGRYGQLAVNLVPQLELVIGAQEPIPDGSPSEHRARFQIVLQNFIGVFASAAHPLVLFLDDLQWADVATIQLIETLQSSGLRYVYVVGSYRSNELESRQVLAAALRRMRTSKSGVEECSLDPLASEDVTQLVAESLGTSSAQIRPLSDLVYSKTEGNPFFTMQFLSALAEQSLLVFDQSMGSWIWDLHQIKGHPVTENVVGLVAGRVGRLSPDAREVTALLACLGNPSSAETLARIAGRSEDHCSAALVEAAEAGILTAESGQYSFVHDQLREAAYATIEDRTLPDLHLRIGRELTKGRSASEVEDEAFVIVDQFNRGAPSIVAEAERVEIARLNLVAGKRAKEATAYRSALGYLGAAVSLLGGDRWADHYDLCLPIYLIHAECALVIGDYSLTQALLDELWFNCRNKVDRASVGCLQVDLHMIQSDNAKGVSTALACLEPFGIVLPHHPSRTDVDAVCTELWRRLETIVVADLIDLPVCDDPDVKAAMRLLQALFSPAAFYDDSLLYLNLCNMVDLTLRHGVAAGSSAGLSWFGMVLGHVLGRYEEGHQFSVLASKLVEKHRFIEEKAKTLFALGVVTTWTRPISEALEIIRSAHGVALSTGDIATATFCAQHTITDLLVRGDNLEYVSREAEESERFAAQAGLRDVIASLAGQQRFIKNMRGETNTFSTFDDAGFSTDAFEAELTSDRMLIMLFYNWTTKGMARFMSGDFPEALAAFEKARPLVFGHIQRMWYEFFFAMSLVETISGDGTQMIPAHRRQIDHHLANLGRWASTCPATFADKYALLRAQIAGLDGNDLEAMRLYDEAIRLARGSGFPHYEGLGNEYAARFYGSRGFSTIADAYLEKARSAYLRWGASGKVRQLEGQFPQLKVISTEVPVGAHGTTFGSLDQTTIIRTSQAISGEIDLRKLIDRLMEIALENSGGERAVLLLAQDEGSSLLAEGRAVANSVDVSIWSAVDGHGKLPGAIARYVMRSHERVLVEDALQDNPFAQDSYFRGGTFRSILCVPLLRYQKAIGVLYIENNQLSHAFTSERLDIVSLVGMQAGISLENARLFRDVQQITNISRKAQEELRYSIDLIPAMVWSVSPDGMGAVFNKQWHEYTGISAEKARDGGWVRAFHPEDREIALGNWQGLVSTGSAGECEVRIRRHDGSYRFYLMRATPLRDANGTIVKWYGTNTDIDDLKRSEQLTTEEKRLLEMVGAGRPLPIILSSAARAAERFVADSKAYVVPIRPDADFPQSIRGDVDADFGNAPGPGPLEAERYHSSQVISLDGTVLANLALVLDKPRTLSGEELRTVQQLARLIGIIIERKRAERTLQSSLMEKEALLKEVHHRVKNNLQLISSLLSLQAARSSDQHVAELFAESHNRVRSMALVHENLYRAGNFARISMEPHIQDLCAHLSQAFGRQGAGIELLATADDIQLDLDKAIPLGLIVSELVSNAYKYAFPEGAGGIIHVKLASADDEHYALSVTDEGVGLPEGVDFRGNTFGLQLVQDLTDQLHGILKLRRAAGSTFEVVFPVSDPIHGGHEVGIEK